MLFTIHYTTSRGPEWHKARIYAADAAHAVQRFVTRRDLCPDNVRKVRATATA